MLPGRAARPATLTGLTGFGLITDGKVPVRTRSEPPVPVSEAVCVQPWKAACEPRPTCYGAAPAVRTTVRSDSQRLSQESKGPNSGCDRAKDRGKAGPATQCPAPGPGCPVLGQTPHLLTPGGGAPRDLLPVCSQHVTEEPTVLNRSRCQASVQARKVQLYCVSSGILLSAENRSGQRPKSTAAAVLAVNAQEIFEV